MKDGNVMKNKIVIFAWEKIHKGKSGIYYISLQEAEPNEYNEVRYNAHLMGRDVITDYCSDEYKDICLDMISEDEDITIDDISLDDFYADCLLDESSCYVIYRQNSNSTMTVDEIDTLIEKYQFNLKENEIFLDNFSLWQK